jgi:hypothetical protein
MWVAVFNNLPEMILGACWTYTMVWVGMRFERWRNSKPSNIRASSTTEI